MKLEGTASDADGTITQAPLKLDILDETGLGSSQLVLVHSPLLLARYSVESLDITDTESEI